MRTKNLDEGTFSIFGKNRSGRPLKNDLIEPIQNILKEDPYGSKKKTAKRLDVAKQTVKRIMIDELHMTKINFKWIPYGIRYIIR